MLVRKTMPAGVQGMCRKLRGRRCQRVNSCCGGEGEGGAGGTNGRGGEGFRCAVSEDGS